MAARRVASAAAPGPWAGPGIVKKVYVAKPVPTWPRPDLDVKKERETIEAKLAEVERKHAGLIRFTGGDLLVAGNDISGWVRDVGDVDGILIVDLTSGTDPVLTAMEAVDKPMLLFTRPYSGWSYVNVSSWMQKGKKADLVASSEFDDLDPYLRLFYTMHHLRKSKVIAISPGTGPRQIAEGFSTKYGTEFKFIGYPELKAAYDSADGAKARQEADAFVKKAVRVVEPSPKDIEDSMRFYLAVRSILEREQANAMTIDCLGGFRRGDLPAYPCVAWSKLNDQGFYGVCEGDILSTVTQIMLTAFSGKPGFVTDPVFDTSRNEIIHAHCVAATSMLGIGGASLPYAVRSHMEDNKGVSLQVMMPVGDTVTVAKFANPGKLLLSTGEVTANVDDPRGCRTKFRTKVTSARRMLEGFSGGLHRVVYYGDYVQPIESMSRLMGFEITREM